MTTHADLPLDILTSRYPILLLEGCHGLEVVALRERIPGPQPGEPVPTLLQVGGVSSQRDGVTRDVHDDWCSGRGDCIDNINPRPAARRIQHDSRYTCGLDGRRACRTVATEPLAHIRLMQAHPGHRVQRSPGGANRRGDALDCLHAPLRTDSNT